MIDAKKGKIGELVLVLVGQEGSGGAAKGSGLQEGEGMVFMSRWSL